MADVTGQFGDQSIELNNAATEATLKQLVAAIALMSAKIGKDNKSQKQLETDMKKFYQQLDKSTDGFKKLNKEQEKANKLQEDANKAAEEKKKKDKEAAENLQTFINRTSFAAGVIGGLTKSALGLGSSFMSLMSDLSNMGNDINAVGGIMGKLPVVGGALQATFGAVAGAATKTYKSFNEAASVGANFNGSIQEMQRSVAGTGLTLDQYTSIIKTNSEALSVLGQGTADGAKRLANLGKEIRNSSIGNDLAGLGMSTEQINGSMAKYAATLSASGKLSGMSNSQLIASTGEYLKNLDAVSKLTGQSKDSLEQQAQARAADAQYLILKSKLGKAGGDNLEVMMNSLPKEMQAAAQQILATGTASGEEAQKLMAVMPDVGKQLMATSSKMRATGDFTAQEMNGLQAGIKKSTEGMLNDSRVRVLGTHQAEQYGGMIVALNKIQQQKGTLEEQRNKQDADLAEQKRLREQGLIKGLDPAQVKSNMERLATASNKFMEALANSPLLQQMLDGFEKALETATPVLIEALTWVGDHFSELAIGIGIVVGAYAVLSGVIMAAQVIQAAQTIAGTGVVASLTAMTASAWKSVIGMMAMAGPFLAVALAVTAAVYIFNKLGGSLDTIVDAFKIYMSMWGTIMDYFKLGIFKVLDMIPGVSYKKEIEETQKSILEREETRSKLADKIVNDAAAKRKKDNEATDEHAKTTQASTKATKDATDAKKDETATATAAGGDKPINWSNPQEVYNAFKNGKTGSGSGAGTPSTGTATATPSTGTPAPLNQDQNKNMELITAALKKQGITDPKYIAATLGNVMKESGGKSQSENLNYSGTSNDRIRSIFGSRAAGKSDKELDQIKGSQESMGEFMYGKDTKIGQSMGNMEPGDGFKYRGRGFIQLTGKNNYAAASKAIYGDDRLVKNPDLVNDPAVAAEVSAWYMKKGQASMAKNMGIDTGNMTQQQANALATSQIAGRDVTKAGGYLGGEVMNKVNAYAQQFTGGTGANMVASTKPGTGVPTTPASSTVATSVANSNAYGAAVTSPNTQTPAAQNPTTTSTRPSMGGGMAKPGQETAATLLAELIMKMDTLIRVSAKTADLNDKQLSVQRAAGADMFSGAAIV